MARLPQPGGDSGNWGTILNDYLSQAHKTDGALKNDSVDASQLASGAVVATKLDSSVQASLAKADSATQPADLAAKYTKPVGGIPLTDLKQAELDVMYAPRKPTIVWLGDSITELGGDNPISGASSPNYNGNGFWPWAQAFMGWPLETLKNAGWFGQRTDEILARMTAGVYAFTPDWCHVLAGTNDISQAIALSTIKTNLTAILDGLEAHGIRPIIGTIPPRSTYTGTQLNDLLALNAWIRSQARSRRGVIVVDYYSVVASPSANGWAGIAETGGLALSGDGIHPGNAAAPRMGKEFARVMTPVLPNSPRLPSSELDTGNMLLYSRFTSGTIASNTPPTGWNQTSLVNGPIAYSRVLRTDGTLPGSALRLVIPTGGSLNLENPNLRASSWSIGESVIGSIDIKITGRPASPSLGTLGCSLQVVAIGAGVSRQCFPWSLTNDNQPNWDHAITLRTPKFVIPAGTTTLKLQLTIAGEGTYDLDRAVIINATRNPDYV